MVQFPRKNNPKKILAAPVMAVGHVNATIGLTLPLLKRGHRVAFFVDTTYQGKLKPLGFEEIVFQPVFTPITDNPADDLAKELMDQDVLGQQNKLKQLENMMEMFLKSEYGRKNTIHCIKEMKKVIQEFQPDLFVLDNSLLSPDIYLSGKPWIHCISIVPLFYFNEVEDLPPACSGFPIDSDRDDWIPFKDLIRKYSRNKDYNDILEEMGYDRYEDDVGAPETQALTVYALPEEYCYPQIPQLKKDWFNIEVFNKNEDHQVVDLKELVPKEFYEDDLDGKFSGKWIYVSMGSMGSADLDLMHRLIQGLAKTNHKYIVSKGPRHKEYELERNMWGDRYLPQTKILPHVDLVITHGGNNSVTETFARGKPMIILPLFADQHDNAQRLQETGYGLRLDPFSFTEQQLQNSIQQLLDDEMLKQRLFEASQRIQSSNKHEQFADLVEGILDNQDESDKQHDIS